VNSSLEPLIYSDKVLDHFENPRNVGSLESSDGQVGTGMAGTSTIGTVVKMQIRVDPQEIIAKACFKTYGCCSAIACSSLLTEWVKGKTLAEAEAIHHNRIAEELALLPVKIHCAVLAIEALQMAIGNYRSKQQSNFVVKLSSVTDSND